MIFEISVKKIEQKLKQQQAFDIGYKWEGDMLQNIKSFDTEHIYLNDSTMLMSTVKPDIDFQELKDSVFYNMTGFSIE